jgi:hypothetical protein
LTYLETRRGTFVDRAAAQAAVDRMIRATPALLAGTSVEAAWTMTRTTRPA